MPRIHRICASAGACGFLALSSACGPTIRPDFDSPEPAARNAAIVQAAAGDDKSSVPRIVPLLDSDDPATRVLAIRALERLTGETLGYDPQSPEGARAEAVERWAQYVRDTQPRAGGVRPGT